MPARKKTAKKAASKSTTALKKSAQKKSASKKSAPAKPAPKKSATKKSVLKKSASKKKSPQKTVSKKSAKKAIEKAINKPAKKTVKKAIKKSSPISATNAGRPVRKAAENKATAKKPVVKTPVVTTPAPDNATPDKVSNKAASENPGIEPKAKAPKKAAPETAGIEPKVNAPKKSRALKIAADNPIWPTIDIAATTATIDAGADAGMPVERGLEAATLAMNLTITFFNGVGRASFEHSRSGNPLNTINVGKSSKVIFDDVRKNDVVTITGDCADRAELFSDRITSEPTQPESPLKYNRVIDEILIIQ